jgi:tetratricopeptide (TPR) repeat protein
MEEGSYEEAKKQLAEARSKLAAVAQGPRESTLSQLILCRQGICSMLMGQYETALKKFENALEENGHYDYSKSPEASKGEPMIRQTLNG